MRQRAAAQAAVGREQERRKVRRTRRADAVVRGLQGRFLRADIGTRFQQARRQVGPHRRDRDGAQLHVVHVHLLRRAACEYSQRMQALIELLLQDRHVCLERGQRIALLLDLQLRRHTGILLRDEQLKNVFGVGGNGACEHHAAPQGLNLEVRVRYRCRQRQRDRIAVEFRCLREQHCGVGIRRVQSPEIDFVAGFEKDALVLSCRALFAAGAALMTPVVGCPKRQRRIQRCTGFLCIAARFFDGRHRRRQREVVLQAALDQRVQRGILICTPPFASNRRGIGERG